MHTFDLQVLLLKDRRRVSTYARAIRRIVRPGDVVLDLGSGTGFLSFLAARAGARRVCGIEQDGIVHVANALARENGLADRVTFLHGRFETTPPPERADVVLTELLTNIGTAGPTVRWFLEARSRLLRPGARVVPRGVRLRLAPAMHAEVARVRRVGRVEGIPLAAFAGMAFHRPLLTSGRPRALAAPRTAADLDLQLLRRSPYPLGSSLVFPVTRAGRFDGFHAWCEYRFAPDLVLSAREAPAAPAWWSAFLLAARRPARVRPGDRIAVELATDGVTGYRWQAEIRRAGATVWRGGAAPELGDARILREAAWRRGERPRFSPAQARDLRLLALCDGRRTVSAIAALARRRGLVRGGDADARIEVRRVLDAYDL